MTPFFVLSIRKNKTKLYSRRMNTSEYKRKLKTETFQGTRVFRCLMSVKFPKGSTVFHSTVLQPSSYHGTHRKYYYLSGSLQYPTLVKKTSLWKLPGWPAWELWLQGPKESISYLPLRIPIAPVLGYFKNWIKESNLILSPRIKGDMATSQPVFTCSSRICKPSCLCSGLNHGLQTDMTMH